jgi:hypothetical protein
MKAFIGIKSSQYSVGQKRRSGTGRACAVRSLSGSPEEPGVTLEVAHVQASCATSSSLGVYTKWRTYFVGICASTSSALVRSP